MTIAWHDPPGAAQLAGDRTPRLVNDLELRVVGPGAVTHFPFVMPFTIGHAGHPAYSTNLHNAAAVRVTNFTDNVEQVLIATPAAGPSTAQASCPASPR